MKKSIIKNIDDPRIETYRSLKMRSPARDGLFIVESRPAVTSLLKTNLEIVSCLTTEEFLEKFSRQIPDLTKKNISFYTMEKKDIENIIGFRFHHGIMMAVKSPEKVPTSQKVKEWRKPHLLIALNGVHDPQNVGLIIRNAAAFGAHALIVDNQTYEPYYRKVVRISMGSIFNLPITYEPDLIPALQNLKKKFKTKIVATSPEMTCTNLHEADFSGNICFVFGNEFSGAAGEIFNIADITVKIPLFFDKADSLNVACASAVCLYQTSLQRQITR